MDLSHLRPEPDMRCKPSACRSIWYGGASLQNAFAAANSWYYLSNLMASVFAGATLFAFAAAFIHFFLELVFFQTISLFNALQTLIPAGEPFRLRVGLGHALNGKASICLWLSRISVCTSQLGDISASRRSSSQSKQ